MEYIFLILLIVIIFYLVLKGEKHSDEIINNLFEQTCTYEELYKSFSQMELLKLFYENNEEFVNRWLIVVDEYNKTNPGKKIIFEKFDLYNNEHFIEDDEQADILIAQTYGVDWIANFRAVCNSLNRIKNIKITDKTIYNGNEVEYSEIPIEENISSVLCTKKRLNELINNNINEDIFNLFNNLNNENYDVVVNSFYCDNNIMEAYPGLSTYVLNNVLDKFVKDYDKNAYKLELYDIVKESINSLTLVLEEINTKNFIKFANYLVKDELEIEILDDFYENYKYDGNFGFLVDSIWETSYNCVELFKYFNSKGYFTNKISWRYLYNLSVNNKLEELQFVLKNLKIDDELEHSCIRLNKETHNEICYGKDLYVDEKGIIQYNVEILTVNFFEAIELNKNIDKKIKSLIKKYFKNNNTTTKKNKQKK